MTAILSLIDKSITYAGFSVLAVWILVNMYFLITTIMS